jgi:hypothetical protein
MLPMPFEYLKAIAVGEVSVKQQHRTRFFVQAGLVFGNTPYTLCRISLKGQKITKRSLVIEIVFDDQDVESKTVSLH